MPILRILIISGFVFMLGSSASAQIPEDGDYMIDASQRPALQRTALRLSGTMNFAETRTLIRLNRRLYSGDLLTKLAPYLKDEKATRSMRIERDEKMLRSYTNDPQIVQLLEIRVKRKLARQIYAEYRALALP